MMAYKLESKDIKLDNLKREILFIQESYKVLIPILTLLVAVLAALNIANAMNNFLSVYVCVLINAIGLVCLGFVLIKLITNNIKQKLDFDMLDNAIKDNDEGNKYTYKRDSQNLIPNAKRVSIIESQEEIIILPVLQSYRHRLFTKYSFKNDFGKLSLPKSECEITETENNLIISMGGELSIELAKEV